MAAIVERGAPGSMASQQFEPGGFSINDLAGEFNVTHRTLHFYEEKGLLGPRRHDARRIYSQRDRTRLAIIIKGKSIGLSLRAIGTLLSFYDDEELETEEYAAVLDIMQAQRRTLANQKKIIAKQIKDIDRHIADLKKCASGPCAGGDAREGGRSLPCGLNTSVVLEQWTRQ